MLMFHIDLVEAHVAGRRFPVQLPRIPVAGDFILVGEIQYRVEEVHLCCGVNGVHEFSWIRALKTPSDIQDVLEEP